MSTVPTAAETCGKNPILPATRLGCGEPIYTCAEVFRCLDCGTPMHKGCLRAHCATSDEKDKEIARLHTVTRTYLDSYDGGCGNPDVQGTCEQTPGEPLCPWCAFRIAIEGPLT